MFRKKGSKTSEAYDKCETIITSSRDIAKSTTQNIPEN